MRVGSTVAVLVLLLGASGACRAGEWEKDNTAGEEALRQGHYQEAERRFSEAVKDAASFPANDLRRPSTLHNLGVTYLLESKYDAAEKTLREVIRETEEGRGSNAPLIALASDSLVRLYARRGQLDKAIKSCERGLEVRKAILGADDPEVATNLSNLATLYFAEARASDSRLATEGGGTSHSPVAEIHTLGRGHRVASARNSSTEVADSSEFAPKQTSIENTIHYDKGRLASAEKYYREALVIREGRLAAADPVLAETLENLGRTYSAEKKYGEAGATYGRLLALEQASGGVDGAQLLAVLDDIAEMEYARKAYAQAAEDYGRDLQIREKTYGTQSPQLVETLRNYAVVLRKLGRKEEAKGMEARAGEILAARRGPASP